MDRGQTTFCFPVYIVNSKNDSIKHAGDSDLTCVSCLHICTCPSVSCHLIVAASPPVKLSRSRHADHNNNKPPPASGPSPPPSSLDAPAPAHPLSLPPPSTHHLSPLSPRNTITISQLPHAELAELQALQTELVRRPSTESLRASPSTKSTKPTNAKSPIALAKSSPAGPTGPTTPASPRTRTRSRAPSSTWTSTILASGTISGAGRDAASSAAALASPTSPTSPVINIIHPTSTMDRERADRADRTPRRSAAAPHTPGELNIVSKVAVQAVAQDGVAKGIICLKLGIPRDATGASWALFNGPTPTLLAIPALYTLPVTPYLLSRGPSNLVAAASLLNLRQKGAYPPATNDAGIQPKLETTKAGQVFVVANESPRQGGRSAGTPSRRESIGLRDRAEFLAIIEFSVPLETSGAMDEHYSATIPVPKCLDNSIKFQILHAAEDDVSIHAEPQVLPTPSSRELGGSNPFQASSPRKRHIEEGWEDGEVPGPDSDESDGDIELGSWLEGRFPSTDTLKLGWEFAPSLDSPPDLRVAPKWDNKMPSIAVMFEAGIPAVGGAFGLEAVLPPGWGWQELEIRGEGLLSWRSTDEDLASEVLEPMNADDSIATEIAMSPSLRSPRRVVPLDASRLEPLNTDDLAPLDDADFSFSEEISPAANLQIMPQTPSRRRKLEAERRALFRVTPRVPVPAGLFELDFDAPAHDPLDSDTEDEEDRCVLSIEGTLVPLPYVLVSPDAPISIPFVRFDNSSLPTTCTVRCPHASFQDSEPGTPAEEDTRHTRRLCSTADSCVGKFTWADDAGNVVPRRTSLPVSGPVRVVVQRNIWGLQTLSAALSWPPRAAEVALTFTVPSVRVVKATSQGASLAHAVLPTDDGGAEVRVAGGRGALELVLEVADDGGVALPSFPEGTGELKVELASDGWDKLVENEPKTNLKRVTDRGFIGTMTSPLIAFSLAPPPKPKLSLKRFISWSALLNLLLFFVLVSMAQQLERVRNEIAFVADEARDLRLYGLERERLERAERAEREKRERESGSRWERLWETAQEPEHKAAQPEVKSEPEVEPVREREPEHQGEPQRKPDYKSSPYEYESRYGKAPSVTGEQGLGRVVFGQVWPAWTGHPVVRGITSTVGQIWRAMLWLLTPG